MQQTLRSDGRATRDLRPYDIEVDFIGSALGSVLVHSGRTRVICTASAEERVPPWLKHGGWVTASYVMLPGATSPRGRRDPGGRGKEIERLIGRSLRASVDLSRLQGPDGPVSLVCDCDVIEADGGTRTASITGGFVALALALKRLREQGRITQDAVVANVAAVSVGLVPQAGAFVPMLDLCYEEDSQAGVDFNVVGIPNGDLVEVQGTAEGTPFSPMQLSEMVSLAQEGLRSLFECQRNALGA